MVKILFYSHMHSILGGKGEDGSFLQVPSNCSDVSMNESQVIPEDSEKRGCGASKPKGVSASCQCAKRTVLASLTVRPNKAVQVQMCCRQHKGLTCFALPTRITVEKMGKKHIYWVWNWDQNVISSVLVNFPASCSLAAVLFYLGVISTCLISPA